MPEGLGTILSAWMSAVLAKESWARGAPRWRIEGAFTSQSTRRNEARGTSMGKAEAAARLRRQSTAEKEPRGTGAPWQTAKGMRKELWMTASRANEIH
jgi:hypothetical protein